VEDAVRFTGFVADAVLAGLYERCGVFAMPSRQEGFGLVYLEAMKSGLPCVASNCDGAQEVVADGQTGILVDPDDSQALAGALIRLLTDETLRTRMGEAGRRRLDAYFTEEHFHRRLWEQIARALAGGAAPCEDQRLRE